MNIGILGTGFGSYHAQLLKQCEKVGRIVVFGRNEKKLQKLHDELGVEVTTSIDSILLDPDLDVVDICLPSHLHRQYAVEALLNGKHVFCETPVSLHLEDAQAMKRAEDQYGKRILVNQFIKFDWAYQYLYESIQQNKYGKLISLSLKRETPPLWGDLGLQTICTKLMIHELDLLTWLFGSIDHFTVWGTESEKKEQSLVRAFFQHPESITEIMVSSQMPETYPFTVSFEAHFERAKLIFHESDSPSQTVTALFEFTANGKQELTLERANSYEKSLEHAICCFSEGHESIISLNHAIQSLKVAIQLKNRLIEMN